MSRVEILGIYNRAKTAAVGVGAIRDKGLGDVVTYSPVPDHALGQAMRAEVAELVHFGEQPLGYWSGGRCSAAGVFEGYGKGDSWRGGGGVADEPGVIEAIAAGLGGAGFGSHGNGGRPDRWMGRSIWIGNRAAQALANRRQNFGR